MRTDKSPVTHLLRPVGHVTDLVRELESWKRRRKNKELDVKPLDMAVNYLKEYRQLISLVSEAGLIPVERSELRLEPVHKHE